MERAMNSRPDAAASLGSLVRQEYQIPESYYFGEVKRGLRNSISGCADRRDGEGLCNDEAVFRNGL